MINRVGNGIKKILSGEEDTLGIYFTDEAIYCCISEIGLNKAHFIEHKIPSGIISGGIVLDVKKLSNELESAVSKIKSSVTFVNISLQSNLIFSTITHLPSNIKDNENIHKAIDLILNVELPWNKELAYTDFVINKNIKATSVSIFSVKKTIVDSYIEVFNNLPFKIISIEFDSISILRIMKLEPSADIFITTTNRNASIVVSRGEIIDFLFPIVINKTLNKEYIKNELERIKNYYSVETGIEIIDGKGQLEFKSSSIEKLGNNIENVNFFSALGAADRVAFYKGNDNNISFVNTKPNEIYRQHKILESLRLITKSVIGIAVILISTHVLFLSIISKISDSNNVFSTQPPKTYSNVLTIKDEVAQLNQVIEMGNEIANQTTRLLPKLLIIDSIFTEGIYPNSILVLGTSNKVTIGGAAATRTQYNNFRTKLSGMKEVQILNFPLGNLNLQVNIPFGITIKTLE